MRVMQDAGVSVVVSLFCFGTEAVLRGMAHLEHYRIRIVGSFDTQVVLGSVPQ